MIMSKRVWGSMLVLVGLSQALWGATLPGSISRDSLITPASLDYLTIGLNGEDMERGMKFEGMGDVDVAVRSYSLYVGVDVKPWLTVFGTVGASETELPGDSHYGDEEVKWSLGANANLWQYDVEDPSWMAGRITIKPFVEIARYASRNGEDDIHWLDFTAMLPFGYEIIEKRPGEGGDVYSLLLYAGPALSMIDGTRETASGNLDIDEEDTFGAVAGVDVYFAENVSAGCQILTFSEGTVNASLRFHF